MNRNAVFIIQMIAVSLCIFVLARLIVEVLS